MSLAEDFAKRYAGLRSAYGTFTASNDTREDGKASGKNITISKELSDTDLLRLWENHLSGQQSVGIVAIDETNSCVWGAIDVDEYQLDLKDLAIKIARFISYNINVAKKKESFNVKFNYYEKCKKKVCSNFSRSRFTKGWNG